MLRRKSSSQITPSVLLFRTWMTSRRTCLLSQVSRRGTKKAPRRAEFKPSSRRRVGEIKASVPECLLLQPSRPKRLSQMKKMKCIAKRLKVIEAPIMRSPEIDRTAARLPLSQSKSRRESLSRSQRKNRRKLRKEKHGGQNRSHKSQIRKLRDNQHDQLRKQNNRNNRKLRPWSTKRRLKARRRKLQERRLRPLQLKS